MSINQKFIHKFARLKASKDKLDSYRLIGCRSDVLGIIYHETRHYQQYFWTIAYALLSPKDFFPDHTPELIQQFNLYLNSVLPKHVLVYIEQHKSRLIDALDLKNCQKQNHLKIGLKRLLLSNLYATKFKTEEDEKKFQKYYPALYPKIEPLMKETFQNPGHQGEKIKYSLFKQYNLLSTGYYLNPCEDDAHGTQEPIIYYEKELFGKMVLPHNQKVAQGKAAKGEDFIFFNSVVTKESFVPDKLLKPTDHNKQYPQPELYLMTGE